MMYKVSPSPNRELEDLSWAEVVEADRDEEVGFVGLNKVRLVLRRQERPHVDGSSLAEPIVHSEADIVDPQEDDVYQRRTGLSQMILVVGALSKEQILLSRATFRRGINPADVGWDVRLGSFQ
jgi:hypothetical protein